MRYNNTDTIYLIYNPITDYYKIGITGNIEKRFKDILSHSSCNVKLLGQIILNDQIFLNVSDMAYEIEQTIHSWFENKRIMGEWFKLDKKDLAILNSFGKQMSDFHTYQKIQI